MAILGGATVIANEQLTDMRDVLANDLLAAMRCDQRGKWIYDGLRHEYRLWQDKPYPPNHQGVIDFLVRLAQERRAS